ncbi:MAG: hypothetical protein KAX95_01630 [Pseudomonas sp.]|nr:hypothetical protein [Pseudomonas sp.]
MHGLLRATLCATLLCPASHTLAANVYRCEDGNGHLTYTLQGCASHQLLQVQNADNPTPGSGKPVPLAKAKKHQKHKTPRGKKSKADKTMLVIGEHQDGCGNQVTGSARRTAMINGQVRSGMPRKDVESALGKPDKITSQNGQMRYLYRDRDGNSKQVSFDENGCVRSKR